MKAAARSKRPVILDPYGRPVRASSVPYDAAGHGRRARNWWPAGESINTIVEGYGDVLRRRSRDMGRRNGWAAAAADRYVSNIVGTGIIPVSQASDDAFRTSIRELWERWVDESDADGLADFYGQQTLVARQCFEAGECFARLRPRRLEDGHAVPLQIQLLEPDFLRHTLNENLTGGRRIRQGIEFDGIGRRVAYHFYREHPGERWSFGSLETTRVPASEVLQVFEPLRPGQLRGLPRLAPVLARLYELDQTDDAAVVRMKVASLFAFFFTKTVNPMLGAEGEDGGDAAAAIESIEPGTGYELQPGEDVRFPDVPDPGPYVEYVKGQLRNVATAADLTYEQLTGDLKGVTYSSIRSGLLEIRRRHEQVQHGVLCFQFNRRVWNRWVSDAVVAGAVDAPADFARRTWAYQKAKWIPQGWSWVDPQKEVNAVVQMIRAGLITRSMAVAQYGYDGEEIDREMAADNERADRYGLQYDSDGRRASSGGGQPAAAAAPREENDEGEDEEAPLLEEEGASAA